MSLSRDIALLRQVPLLSDFADEQLRLLAFSAENVVAGPQEVIYREGERSDASYVIASGSVALHAERDGSGEVIAEVGVGTMLGQMALLTAARRANTAMALEQTELVRIRRALFRRMLQEYPEIAHALHHGLAERLQSQSGEMMRVADALDALNLMPLNERRR